MKELLDEGGTGLSMHNWWRMVMMPAVSKPHELLLLKFLEPKALTPHSFGALYTSTSSHVGAD